MFPLLVWFTALVSVPLWADAGPCDFTAPQPVAAGDTALAKEVLTIFTTSCAKCHGKGATGGASVMADILDRDALLRDAMIDLTDPAASRIIAAVNRKSRPMPLGGTPLTDIEKDKILTWIKGGAPNWNVVATINDPILSQRQEWNCALWDLKSLKDKNAAQYVRYLSFGHLKGKEFVAARDGAIEWVNHLHKRPRATRPLFVDTLGKIIRLDLRDYEPTLNIYAWEHIVINGYPYALIPEDRVLAFYIDELNQRTYSERGMVRGDFFISKTSQGDDYYNILQTSKTLQDFEKYQLGIDTEKDLVTAYAKRGSVAKSGVANYPRLVDRFDLFLNTDGAATPGAHWVTRDFNSDKGTSNIYAFPFGPRILLKYFGWTEAQFFAAKVFENQAGESITQLPSGFQQYGIWDGKGKRLKAADTHIAVERSGLFDDQSVQNAISCAYCHAGGINPFDDDSVIRAVRSAASFTVAEVQFAEDLFFTKDQRSKAFADHATAFKNAMTSIGLTDPIYLTPDGQPTVAAFRKFEGNLTCLDLAWELGISLVDLQSHLSHSPDLAREAGLADCVSGRLSRKNYVHLFPKLVKNFNLGVAIAVGNGHVNPYVPPVVKCQAVYSNVSNHTVKFQVAGTQYQINHGATVTANYQTAQTVSNVWHWTGRAWWTGYNSWTAQACKNYAFKWNTNRVTLYQN